MTFKKGKDILETKTFELYKQKHYGNNPCCDYEDKINILNQLKNGLKIM
jgi:hypothetical protein